MNSSRLPLLVLFLASVAWSQDYRGRVQGVITDPSSAAVANVTVTLLNANTKTASSRVTDEAGRYLFDFVEPGTYTLTAEGAGFGRFIQENVQVLVRSDLTVNASLRLGDVVQTVTVGETAVECSSTPRHCHRPSTARC